MENTVITSDSIVTNEPQRELTFGERAVNVKFNPPIDGVVNQDIEEIKAAIAKVIDLVADKEAKGYLANTYKGMAIRSLITASSDAVRWVSSKEK